MKTYPTRHGDWHEIDGQLVDLSQSPSPEFPDSSEAADGQDATGNDANGSDADGGTPSLASLPPSSPKRRTKPED